MSEPKKIQRLNYFTHQFLEEEDFKDEQAYHIGMRHQNNKMLYSWGIVEGLSVKKSNEEKRVSVSSGMAIDNDGKEIVLQSEYDESINKIQGAETYQGKLENTVIYLTIKHKESFDKDYSNQTGNASKPRRIVEKSIIELSADKPATDGAVILLAKITLDGNGNFSNDDIDLSERKYAGVKRLQPGLQSILDAATLFLKHRDAKQIVFDENTENEAPSKVTLPFRPELILFWGTSSATLRNENNENESHSGLIHGFVINKPNVVRAQKCFCSGGTKNQQGYWIQNTETASDLCRVLYQDEAKRKGETLVIGMGDIEKMSLKDNNYAINLKFNRKQVSGSWEPIDEFKIDIWMLCLG